MTEIKILIQGYAREIKNGWTASSTVVLIKNRNKNIIVDPGCNRKKLLDVLEKEKLKTSEVDFIISTHNHLDHILLAGIFENAKVLTTEEIYNNDKQTEHNNIVHGTDLKIIQTSGHCSEHCSVVVPVKEEIYVVAGDVFWWTDKEKQIVDIKKVDDAHPEEVDMKKLIESRKEILKIADYIIPGHGKIFKV
ncbi:MBL fold metallo-hydrolase [Candidatus Parcubacteria bacterium]|nr:MBL fold metallo-hydrolase [Candidatus Parcubacteria bacterium]